MKAKHSLFVIIFYWISSCSYTQTQLTLKDAFLLARKNNPFYRTEKMNSDIAKTDITTAKLQYNPTFNISYIQVPSAKYFPENTAFLSPANRQISYQVSKTFQVHGQRKNKILQAENDYTLSQVNLDEYERNLFGDVSDQWLNVWYATQKLIILMHAKANSDTLLKINQIRLKDQVITTTEFLRTQIVSDQYNLMLINAQQNLKTQINELRFTLGINDSILVNDNDEQFYLRVPDKYDTILNYALRKRTDIILSNRLAEKAKTEIQLQKSLAYPQPEVGFNYGAQNQVPYVGTYLAIPIPAFNRNQGEIEKSKIALTQSQSLLSANILKAKTEVQTAYGEYMTYKSSYEKYKEIFKKSETVLKTVRLSYLKGGTTILDYLEAERNWFDLQNEYYEAYYNYKKSFLQLLFVSNLIETI